MSDPELPGIIVVCGPTCSGKTSFGIALAETVGGEIVGADSLQVYRRLDIGTAKPSAADRARVPHHVIDVRDPDEQFNVAIFKELADAAILDIRERGHIPIVVGGTGLYLRILVRGIFEAPRPDEELRLRLRQEIDVYGVEQLYRRLCLVDPVLSERVEAHDRNRIIRGLEIFEQTGIPLSEHQQVHDFGIPSYRALKIGLNIDRALLYERIESRAEQMMRDGLHEEYQELLAAGFDPGLKPMMSLGYRQMAQVAAGKLLLEEAPNDIARATKRYAKRQNTWFRKEADAHWLNPMDVDMAAVAADVRLFMDNQPIVLGWEEAAP
jgi:tRNA dimethylallyltransferase